MKFEYDKNIRITSTRRARKRRLKFMNVEEFDKKFDDGEDISEYLDMSSIRKPNLELKSQGILTQKQ